MNTNFMYWPYDEVSLSASADGKAVVVKTPWLEATVGLTPETQADVLRLVEKFHSESLAAEDLPLVSWFFTGLAEYPLSYILPAPKAGPDLDQPALKDDALLALDLKGLLQTALGAEHDAAQIAAMLGRSWDWDAEAALSFAMVDGKVHPESVFTVARRYHTLDVVTLNEGSSTFEEIAKLDGERFARAAGLMVRQNHYVTQQCKASLLPAVQTAGRARGQVERFIKEEDGHDKILNVAMTTLAKDPEAVPVSPLTKALMQLLRYAAGRNFLAFAMVVDFFERSTYEDKDPLARLLAKGGFDKAARQINRHMDINDAGEHENVACGFLADMAPVDPPYALEALRIAEAVSLVMNAVPQSALELYRSTNPA